MRYPPSELVLNANGEVYHLGLNPSQIADDIILVGDQSRVDLVSQFFDSVEHKSQHREFVCHTGTYKEKRISVISSGIGTDNIDIVVNELDALANIDLNTRENKTSFRKLNLIRIGTCGILQSPIPVHSYILTRYAVGLDNVAHFYPISFSAEEKQVAEAIATHIGLPKTIVPYASEASEILFQKLRSEQTFSGITMTSSGFYAPQGRSLRLGLAVNSINEKLGTFDFGNLKVTNFEMESSALFALGKAMGHECATICLGIANRPNNEFSRGYETEMNELIQYVLNKI
jgi:uridine phosphorylase